MAHRQSGVSRQCRESASKFARVSPRGLTLTATIAGRTAGGRPRIASARTRASSGQTFRQRGSRNVTIVVRPRNDRNETDAPRWSTSRKLGAARAPASQVTGGGVTVGDWLAREAECPRTTTRAPATTPSMTSTAATASRRERPRRPLSPGGSVAGDGCAATAMSDALERDSTPERVESHPSVVATITARSLLLPSYSSWARVDRAATEGCRSLERSNRHRSRWAESAARFRRRVGLVHLSMRAAPRPGLRIDD